VTIAESLGEFTEFYHIANRPENLGVEIEEEADEE
jgi:hypothetical protein